MAIFLHRPWTSSSFLSDIFLYAPVDVQTDEIGYITQRIAGKAGGRRKGNLPYCRREELVL